MTTDLEGSMHTGPERGIVITPAELAVEGVEAVLDAIAHTGANAITTSTTISVEATPETGFREPPLDVAGAHRTLDRPLWDKRVVWVQRFAPHPSDPALWADVPWDPPLVAPETHRTDWTRLALDSARARGMRTYVQLTPYQIPGTPGGQEGTTGDTALRDAFRPRRLVEGPHPEGIAYTGCLNHPVVRSLGRTRLRELLRHYGDADGISLDWVEYPVYFLEKVFTCFCEHCERQATALGYEWDTIVDSARILWDSLHTVRPEDVTALIESGDDWFELVPDPATTQAGLNDWLDFKAASVTLALKDLRETMRASGAGAMRLSTNSSPLPWGRASGSVWPPLGGPVDTHRAKLYSFHWLMMVNWWSSAALRWNQESGVSEETMVRATLALFDLHLQEPLASLHPEQFGMPLPGAGHGLTPASYHIRLENSLAQNEAQAPLMPLVHAYRSPEDLRLVLDAVRPYSGDGIWVQRYGYLSDEKLEILRREWS